MTRILPADFTPQRGDFGNQEMQPGCSINRERSDVRVPLRRLRRWGLDAARIIGRLLEDGSTMKLRYAAVAAILSVATCGVTLAAEPDLGADNSHESKLVADGATPAQHTQTTAQSNVQNSQTNNGSGATTAPQTGGAGSK